MAARRWPFGSTTRRTYFLLADFAPYVACQARGDALYLDPEEWTRRAVLNVAGTGQFSSGRAVLQYAETVWGVSPVKPGKTL
jgi:starch phosphorylase